MRIIRQLFLLLVMLLSCINIFAHDFEVDDIYYTITSSTDKTVAVSFKGDDEFSYHCEYSGSIVIPECVVYNGFAYDVTSITWGTFSECKDVTSITIPNSVTQIGVGALDDTSWYKNLPDGVIYINNVLYKYKGDMPENTSIHVKDGTVSITSEAFKDCSNLISVTLPSSIREIPSQAFYGCSGLTSITIPDGITFIDGWAFKNCSKLASINIPYSVKRMGQDVFTGTAWFDNQPDGVVYINDMLYKYKGEMPANTTINVLEGTRYISPTAFSGCSGLTSIILPNSVNELGYSVFWQCPDLESVVISDSVKCIPNSCFYECTKLKKVTLPEKLEFIDIFAFYYTRLSSITIPYSVDSIGVCAFEGCPLREVNVSCKWENNPLYEFKDWTKVNAVLHEYHNGVCTGCGKPGIRKLTFKVDGVVYATIEQSVGTPPTLPAPPQKSGYTFTKWENLPEIMPDEDVIVEAAFTINSYTISYLIDGDQYTSQTVKYGSTITPPDAPQKEGYTFSGWQNLPKIMPANDITVTGKYTVNTYKVTFKIGDKFIKTIDVKYGQTIIAPSAPEKEGHIFDGWQNIPDKMPAHDIVIHGSYTIQKYLLSFVVSGIVLKQGLVEFGSVIETPIVPEKEGHIFAGWENLPKTMPAHELEVRGSYTTLKYQLTFIIDGEIIQQNKVNYGTVIEPPTAPEKVGYFFVGWKNMPETMPANDLNIYGSYAPQKYLLTFSIDDQIIQQSYVDYGAEIIAPTAPDKEGHKFNGWKNVPKTMPAYDLEIKSSYTIQDYLLTFIGDGKVIQQNWVTYGTIITTPTAPNKTGHTFTGWENMQRTMPGHDLTVTATYSVNEYKLTYILDGKVYAEVYVPYGERINPLEVEVDETLTFDGWNNLPETMPAHDVTVMGTTTPTSIDNIIKDSSHINVYTVTGVLVAEDVTLQWIKDNLKNGVYIVNGKKVFVK